MSEQLEKPQSKPWKWPGEWFRDEKFWRDVASRTTSGILVVIIGLAYAGFTGYIKSPDWRRFHFGLGVSLVLLIPSIIVWAKYGVPYFSDALKTKNVRRVATALVGVAVGIALVTVWIYMSVLVSFGIPF